MTTGQGQDSFAYVDGAALSFPVVIDSTHNQFAFNSTQYIVPSGSYANAKALAHAVNQATTGFHAVVSVTASTAVPGALRFTSQSLGNHTEAFAAGSSNDCLSAKLGITAAWTIAHTQAATHGGASSAQGTLYGASTYFDGTRYVGNAAQVGEDNI